MNVSKFLYCKWASWSFVAGTLSSPLTSSLQVVSDGTSLTNANLESQWECHLIIKINDNIVPGKKFLTKIKNIAKIAKLPKLQVFQLLQVFQNCEIWLKL